MKRFCAQGGYIGRRNWCVQAAQMRQGLSRGVAKSLPASSLLEKDSRSTRIPVRRLSEKRNLAEQSKHKSIPCCPGGVTLVSKETDSDVRISVQQDGGCAMTDDEC